MNGFEFPRRQFLQTVAAASILRLSMARSAVTTASAGQRRLSAGDVRDKLRGPILSIPTPFTADFQVDHAAIREMVRRGCAAGIPIFALTAGNGQYTSLETSEIRDLTRVLVESVGGRGITIAAAGNWWTGQVESYGKFAQSIGADALQVMLPEGVDDEAIQKHFETIAGASDLPIVLQGDYSSKLLDRLVKIPSVIALKEDVTLDYYIDRQRHFGDRLTIFGGGSEHRFMVARPYGSHCYYSAYAAFSPEISMQFWNMVQTGDEKGAYAWVNRYDLPFIEHWSHAFWRGSLEYFGIGKRFLRPPQKTLTDAEMNDLKAFYRKLELSPT